jgi:L-lactate dehydrogenase (cytochrome)
VLIGRPFLYGLAFAGQPGVEKIIEIFRTELLRTMKLMGCPALSALDASWVQPTRSWQGTFPEMRPDRLPERASSSANCESQA